MTGLDQQRSRAIGALNKMAKWRMILAGWQLGTRTSDDPTSRAVRDHRDQTMMAQADLDALMALLTEKDAVTEQERDAARERAGSEADQDMRGKFPGDVTGGDSWPAVREHREVTLRLRAQANALVELLMRKGVFSELEYLTALEAAALQLDRDMENKFPGARTSDVGVHFYDMDKVFAWMSKFPP